MRREEEEEERETRGGETGGGERKIFRVEGNSPNCRWISSLESLSKRKLANFIPPPVLASRKRRERCMQTHKEESTTGKRGRIPPYCYSPYSRNVCQPIPFFLPLPLLIPSFSPLQVSFSRYRCHVAKNVHAKGEDRKENKKDRQSFSLSFLSPLQFLCDLVEDTNEVFFYLFRRCLVASGDKIPSWSDQVSLTGENHNWSGKKLTRIKHLAYFVSYLSTYMCTKIFFPSATSLLNEKV